MIGLDLKLLKRQRKDSWPLLHFSVRSVGFFERRFYNSIEKKWMNTSDTLFVRKRIKPIQLKPRFTGAWFFMAIEHFIHGKHDKGHHEGKRSEVRRLATTDDELRALWPELWDAVVSGRLERDQELKPNQVVILPPTTKKPTG